MGGGASPESEARTYYLDFFAENCMKMKEIGSAKHNDIAVWSAGGTCRAIYLFYVVYDIFSFFGWLVAQLKTSSSIPDGVI